MKERLKGWIGGNCYFSEKSEYMKILYNIKVVIYCLFLVPIYFLNPVAVAVGELPGSGLDRTVSLVPVNFFSSIH